MVIYVHFYLRSPFGGTSKRAISESSCSERKIEFLSFLVEHFQQSFSDFDFHIFPHLKIQHRKKFFSCVISTADNGKRSSRDGKVRIFVP
jgi:hypothetical protein